MSDKSTKFRDFFQGVLPGGVVRSDSGVAINVSANGTSTVAAKELEKVIFKRFNEMKTTDSAKLAAKSK